VQPDPTILTLAVVSPERTVDADAGRDAKLIDDRAQMIGSPIDTRTFPATVLGFLRQEQP
jgi:hypothetical protein